VALSIPAAVALAGGSGWTIEKTPRLPHRGIVGLTSVSCSSPTACVAVGVQQRSYTSAGTSIAERLSGTTWTMQTLPVTPRGELKAVSCSSPTSCLAVGQGSNPYTGLPPTGQVADFFNGKSWSAVPTPDAGPLISVSCDPSGSCMAVGQSPTNNDGPVPASGPTYPYAGIYPLVERFDGRSLSIMPVPLPAPTAGHQYYQAYFTGISCASSTSCNALGAYTTLASPGAYNLGSGGNFAEHWDGTTWRLVAYPAPAGAIYTAPSQPEYGQALTCTTDGHCIAFGIATHASGPPALALAARRAASPWYMMRFDGTQWTAAPFVAPSGLLPGYFHGPWSVSCTSPVACTAVGSVPALRFNGKTWRSQALPAPTVRAAPDGYLRGVSCTTSRSCIAVGGNLHNQPLAIRWTGAG
jgi:hypothetical protein